MKSKSKKRPRPSGVTMTTNRRGEVTLRSFGPNAPDLRGVFPALLGDAKAESAKTQSAAAEDDECQTCLGACQIRDGETNELRRCLDCGGSGRQ